MLPWMLDAAGVTCRLPQKGCHNQCLQGPAISMLPDEMLVHTLLLSCAYSVRALQVAAINVLPCG